MKKPHPQPEPKLYQDEIYHDKVLSPLAVAIIDTPEFQRLDGLKQLGFAHLTYRGATHTRLSHSIGVYFACRTLLRRIAQNHERLFGRNPELGEPHPGILLSEKLAMLASGSRHDLQTYKGCQGPWRGMTEVVSAAALLHDIGHVPFGHTLEDEYSGICEKHDSLASPRLFEMLFDSEYSELARVFSDDRERWLPGLPNRELQRLIFVILSFKEKVTDDTFKSFGALIASEIKKHERTIAVKDRLKNLESWHSEFSSQKLFHPFMSDVIANTICADILDYLSRDQRNLGIESRSHKRILRYFLIRRGSQSQDEGSRLCLLVGRADKGGQRRDVATSILDIMRERYAMAERVLYHHKKAAASAMLVKLFEICSDEDKPRPGEGVYPAPWNGTKVGMRIGENGNQSPNLVHLSDHDMLEYLGTRCKVLGGKQQLQRKLYLGIRYRKLYRTLLVVDRPLAPQKSTKIVEDLWGDPTEPSTFDAALRARVRLETELSNAASTNGDFGPGDVLIYCPSGKMQSKEIDVRVELSPREVYPLRKIATQFTLREDIRVLRRYYDDLWRMYIFVDPRLYEDDKKCLRIVETFCAEYDISVEEAIRKSRKPRLRELYQGPTKGQRMPPVTHTDAQIGLPIPEEPVLAKAARMTSNNFAPATQVVERAIAEPSDEELFAGIVPKLAKAKNGNGFLTGISNYLERMNLGPLRNHVDLLRKIRKKLEQGEISARKVFTERELTNWLGECEAERNDGRIP